MQFWPRLLRRVQGCEKSVGMSFLSAKSCKEHSTQVSSLKFITLVPQIVVICRLPELARRADELRSWARRCERSTNLPQGSRSAGEHRTTDSKPFIGPS